MTARFLQMSGIVADLLYEVDQVPVAGKEAIVSSFKIAPGGGFNAMVAAKRAGLRVCYGGSIGSGPFANLVREGLSAEEIPFLRTQDMYRDQGCCTVLIDQNGERTFIASDGAEGHVTPEALAQINFVDFEWTLLSGYALHYRNSRGALTDWLHKTPAISGLVFDPAPIVASLAPNDLQVVLSRAEWVSANLHEAAILTAHSDPVTAAKALAKDRPGGAIVRNGAAGCVVATAEICVEIPAFPVQVIDTNGAGDTHVGSFIANFSQTGDPELAARFANTAAAISTTIKGPATAPTAEQINRVLSQ
ncbi:ribokinase [Phaeobacter gallaeciensis]|uniref:Ribokinase n=2 Tax=Roseobacteraceae TaxID=2854170 RepID=A0A366WZX1_9RHOB|nr:MULTISPECIES: PfkB family carbohydrate kinase [Roseobacteraceae]MBT3141012.1 ribokinase [Falsiruegeria litorea]MBT8168097.1 ribokinase [Falsiruegeria litorea]RBW56140.1 ribokinase [Phaeobacter gallaeciensis]